MEIDPLDTFKSNKTTSSPWLNAPVTINIAHLATFMGVCKVKEGNIVLDLEGRLTKDQAPLSG